MGGNPRDQRRPARRGPARAHSAVAVSGLHESHAFELRAAFYNAFNQVRRTGINTSLQYKANGRAYADGLTLFNTPEALATRNANLSGTAPYNQYRTGVGHTNLTDVNVLRVIEIGLKYRF